MVVDPNRGASLNKNDGGYVFPDPGLFLGVSTPETQAKFFCNWLKYRPALMYRLTAQNSDYSKPLSSQVWRSMLHLQIDGQVQTRADPTPGPRLPPASTIPCPPSFTTTRNAPASVGPQQNPQTKSAKRLEVVHTLLQNCLNVDGVQVNHAPSGNIFWHERQLPIGLLPPQRIGQEILWELFELNFRFEFMALDRRAHQYRHPCTKNDIPREDLLLRCFPGDITGSIIVARREFAQQGLAASNWKDRAPFILAVKNVMLTWSGFDDVIQNCSDVDLRTMQDVEAYSKSEIHTIELVVATFYTQSFYDFFGCAAIIPRRLATEPLVEHGMF